MDWEGVLKYHNTVFGVYPVITGINFHKSNKIIEWILDAIENGKPYIEEEVEDGVLI